MVDETTDSTDGRLSDRRQFLRSVTGASVTGFAASGAASTASAHHVENIDIEPERVTTPAGDSASVTVHWVSGHGSDACFVFALRVAGEWQRIGQARQSALDTGEHVHLETTVTIPEDVDPGEYTLRVSASEAYHRCPHAGEKNFPILAADATITVTPSRSLEDLTRQKLSLAGSVDENGLGFVADREMVEPALAGLREAVDAGDLGHAAGADAMERMIYGERVTDAVLAGAGPGDSEFLDVDVNVARLTGESAVNPMLEVLFAGISLLRIARYAPVIGGAVARAARTVARWVADFAGQLSPTLERYIRIQGADAGYQIFSTVEGRAKKEGKGIAEEEFLDLRDDASTPFVEDGTAVIFRDYLFSETYDFQGNPTTPLDDSLERLVDGLDADDGGPDYSGDRAEAQLESQRALDDVNAIYENAEEQLEESATSTFLEHADALELLLVGVALVAGVTGFLSGIGAIAGAAAALVGISTAALNLMNWGIGATSILAARYRHQNAVQGVLAPGGS